MGTEMHAEEIEAGTELVETQPEVEEMVETLETAPDLVEEQVIDVTETAADLPVEAEEPQAIEAPASTDEEMPEVEMIEEDVTVGEVQPLDTAEAQAEVEEVPAAGDVEVTEEGVIPEEPQPLDMAEAQVEVEEMPEAEVGEEVEQAEVEIPADGRAWYVIHCYSGYEAKVRHNLEQRIETMQMQDQIFQVVVPTEDEIEVRDGKRRVVERRVFPGYILVQMLLNDDSWYVVRNTPGVTGFVGMGNEPTPLRPEEVQGIMKRMEAEAPKIKVTFRQGQKVRIIDGPFNEFIGVVDEIDMERAKVRVLVSFFGRETPVELDFLQVEKT
jgi:transcriptional antiterminator NusG